MLVLKVISTFQNNISVHHTGIDLVTPNQEQKNKKDSAK